MTTMRAPPPPRPTRPTRRVPALPALPPVTVSEHEGIRYLHLGSVWVQGAMRIRAPRVIVLEYVRRMLASLLWLPTPALGGGLAVQLGLGAGAITRFTALELGMQTLAVEINPQVVTACRVYFDLPDDGPRLAVRRLDAMRWLRHEARAGSVRLLHVDLYDQEAAAPVLDDKAFYAACRRVLEPGGVMSVNLFGRDASHAASTARIAAAFGVDQVWSLRPTREGNTAVIATRGAALPPRDERLARADTIEQRFGGLGLEARQWLRMVRPLAAPAPDDPLVEDDPPSAGPGGADRSRR